MAKQPKSKYIRNKSLEDYQREIHSKESRQRAARKLLGNFLRRMEAVQADFRFERDQILAAEAKRSRRPQSSSLTLYVYTEGINRVPFAVWNQFIRFTKESAKRHGKGFITPRIRRRGKFGWSLSELAKHAHPLELALVERTEAELTNLRKSMVPYKKSAETLSRSLAKLRRGMRKKFPSQTEPPSAATGEPTGKSAIRKGPSHDAPFRGSMTDDKPMRPQFKHPDGVL